MEFADALRCGDLEAVRKCLKADLHNHFVLGGSREYLHRHLGRDIQPIKNPIHSMDEMHIWNAQNMGDYFDMSVFKTEIGRENGKCNNGLKNPFKCRDFVLSGVFSDLLYAVYDRRFIGYG